MSGFSSSTLNDLEQNDHYQALEQRFTSGKRCQLLQGSHVSKPELGKSMNGHAHSYISKL